MNIIIFLFSLDFASHTTSQCSFEAGKINRVFFLKKRKKKNYEGRRCEESSWIRFYLCGWWCCCCCGNGCLLSLIACRVVLFLWLLTPMMFGNKSGCLSWLDSSQVASQLMAVNFVSCFSSEKIVSKQLIAKWAPSKHLIPLRMAFARLLQCWATPQNRILMLSSGPTSEYSHGFL